MVLVGIIGLVFALAPWLALAAEPPPGEEPPFPPAAIAVVVRTEGDVCAGQDLRYGDGQFRLRQGGGEVALPEAGVRSISFLEFPRDEWRDPVLGLALSLALSSRRAQMPRRPHPALRLRDGVFLLPDEATAETFRWLFPKVVEPSLAAALCVEVAWRCAREKQARAAVALFQEAEAAMKARPDVAFVYGLMQAAALVEQELPTEARQTLLRIEKAYPGHMLRIVRFGLATRGDGERPLPPRPLKDIFPPRAPKNN